MGRTESVSAECQNERATIVWGTRAGPPQCVVREYMVCHGNGAAAPPLQSPCLQPVSPQVSCLLVDLPHVLKTALWNTPTWFVVNMFCGDEGWYGPHASCCGCMVVLLCAPNLSYQITPTYHHCHRQLCFRCLNHLVTSSLVRHKAGSSNAQPGAWLDKVAKLVLTNARKGGLPLQDQQASCCVLHVCSMHGWGILDPS